MSRLEANLVFLGSLTTAQRDALSGVSAGSIIYNSTAAKVQCWSGSKWDDLSNVFEGSGGTVATPGNGYKYHSFTSPGNFVADGGSVSGAEILVVGGGGGGGCNQYGFSSGRGGAGGLRNISGLAISPGSYPITVGPGQPCGRQNGNTRPPAGNSQALGYTANGGGKGSQYCPGCPPGNITAGPGGSGGGGGVVHNYDGRPGGGGNIGGFSPPEGNAGGPSSGGAIGGGGGAGGAGGRSNVPGPGVTLPAFNGPLIGQPALAPLGGNYAKGGPNPTSITGSGYGGNQNNSGRPGIVVIRYPV